jgi:hypothetical protein
VAHWAAQSLHAQPNQLCHSVPELVAASSAQLLMHPVLRSVHLLTHLLSETQLESLLHVLPSAAQSLLVAPARQVWQSEVTPAFTSKALLPLPVGPVVAFGLAEEQAAKVAAARKSRIAEAGVLFEFMRRTPLVWSKHGRAAV